MSETEAEAICLTYSVYRSSPFGAVQLAGHLHARSDSEALRQARTIVTGAPGELREGGRIVCRFGRADGFMLQGRGSAR